MNKKAKHAVTRARTVLLVSQPFYGTLALQLELVETNDKSFCSTMAVDGRHLFYDPDFVLGLSEDELVGVNAHEVGHCAYQHMTRRGHRDPRLWNVAGDYAINQDLLDAGFVLPKKRLHDPKYKGMSTEEIYEKLLQDAPQMKGGNDSGQGGGQGDQDGEGNGTGPDGQQGVPDDGGCGGVLDAGGPGNSNKKAETEAEWEGHVRTAAAVAAKNAGKMPAHIQRLISQLNKPRVSWRDLTRRFIDNSMIKDFSYARPNRRGLGGGMIMPGYISDRLNHLVVIIDTSGSVTNDMLKKFVSEAAGALDDGTADKMTLMYADADVNAVDEWNQGDLVVPRPVGGGGTDFRPSMKWVKENAPEASCVIYLTDMLTTSFGEDPLVPVLWAAYLPYEQYSGVVGAGNPPFGETVYVGDALLGN